MEQPALEHDDNDMPAEADHDLEHPLDDRGGADDIDSDDYPIIDDDPDDGSIDDDLAALADDIFVIVNHYLNHPDVQLHDGPDDDGRGESDPAGESE